MNLYLYNSDKKECYAEFCSCDGRMEVMFFDSKETADKHKPSNKWQVCDVKRRKPFLTEYQLSQATDNCYLGKL
jgi:hypothetical protein